MRGVLDGCTATVTADRHGVEPHAWRDMSAIVYAAPTDDMRDNVSAAFCGGFATAVDGGRSIMRRCWRFLARKRV